MINAIENKLVELTFFCKKSVNENKLKNPISLMQGDPGVYLFLKSQVESEKIKQEILTRYQTIFDKPINALTFCDGILGFCWFLNYMGIRNRDLFNSIDEFSYNYAINSLQINNNDYLHGAQGSIIYLLDRVKENYKASDYLKDIATKLIENGVSDRRGLFWYDNNGFKGKQDEIVNLSLSHGQASKIVLLSKLIKNEINDYFIKDALLKTVDFIFNSKNEGLSSSIFPSVVNSEKLKGDTSSRLAWCYGDLGICIALWQAGDSLNDNSIKNEAIEICLSTIKRKNDKNTGILDAGVCHGTAGVAYIYNKMFNYTGKNEFKNAADYWLKRTLDFAIYDNSPAGYMTWNNDGCKNDYSFLTGISGIGLVLNSFIDSSDSSWDRIILLS